jgi:rhodanese-related sulfurtransferase
LKKSVLISCATGAQSHAAYSALHKLEFQDLHVLSGGLGAWKQANMPVEKS